MAREMRHEPAPNVDPLMVTNKIHKNIAEGEGIPQRDQRKILNDSMFHPSIGINVVKADPNGMAVPGTVRPEGRPPNAVETLVAEREALRAAKQRRKKRKKPVEEPPPEPAMRDIVRERVLHSTDLKPGEGEYFDLDACLDRMTRAPFNTNWGYDNTLLGFNKSCTKVVMADVMVRMQRGDVARTRPIDLAMGRNIKYQSRHTASTTVQSPNYAFIDPIRRSREENAARALTTIASLPSMRGAEGAKGLVSSATAERGLGKVASQTKLSRGSYAPWGASATPWD